MIKEPKTIRKCSNCKKEYEFNGQNYYCRECNREYCRKYQSLKTIEYRRGNALKQQFNMTLEQYTQMNEEQGGVCKICGGVNLNGRALAVDHCHKTGKIRGLLCMHCNSGLGLFLDSPELLEKAMQYLRAHLGPNL